MRGVAPNGWWAGVLGLSVLAGACAGDQEAQKQVQRDLASLRQDIVAINLTLDSQRAQTDRRMQEIGRRSAEGSAEEGRGRAALAAQLQELHTEVRLVQGRLEENARTMGETNRRVDRLSERLEEGMNRVAGLGTQMVSLEGQIQAQQEREDQLARPAPPAAAPAVQPSAGAGATPGGRPDESRLTPASADQVYRTALTDFTRQNFEQSLRGFQTFVLTFPQDSRVSDAQYWLAESYRGQGNYPQAAKEFEAFVRKYPESTKIATAQVRHGESLVLSGDKSGCAILQAARTQFPRARAGALAKDLMAQHCS